MNWNGQQPHLNHLIALLSEPDRAHALQADFNVKRRSRIAAAQNVRPVYIPFSFTMTAAGRTNPYRQISAPLGYDVLVIGFKADTQTRDLVLRRTEDEKPILYVGDEVSLYLRVDDIAGQGTTNGGGQLGVFSWPSPIHLRANQRITMEMYKTDITAGIEVANIVLIGIRVFKKEYAQVALDGSQRSQIEWLLNARTGPVVRFLKHKVEFDADGVGGEARNLYTPQVDEPLLIRGVRTTLRQTTLECGITDEPSWTTEATPCWAIAAEDDVSHEAYQWFSKPIYLRPRKTIEISRAINGNIDQVNSDSQTGNTITWLCETV